MIPKRCPSGLLDSLAGTPTGAWSLRQLASGCCPEPILLARRLSDGVTQEFGGSGQCRYVCPAELEAFAGGGSVAVASLYDQTGGGFDLDTTTTPLESEQPLIVVNGVVPTSNGKPALLFNSLFSTLKSTMTLAATTADVTTFSVVQVLGDSHTFIFNLNASTSLRLFHMTIRQRPLTDPSYKFIRWPFTPTDGRLEAPIDDPKAHMQISTTRIGATFYSTIRQNGVEIGNLTGYTLPQDTSAVSIGSRGVVIGSAVPDYLWQEFILYASDAGSDIATIEQSQLSAWVN